MTHPIGTDGKHKEQQTIKQILHNFQYNPNDFPNPNRQKHHNEQGNPTTEKRNWAKFTYVGKEVRHIIKFFLKKNRA
jgi:hypothetical protein